MSHAATLPVSDPRYSQTSVYQPKREVVWHQIIVEAYIDNPGATAEELARKVGRHPSYVGAILRSDMVRARIQSRLAERRSDADALISKELQETTVASLKLLRERLTQNTDRMGTGQVIDSAQTLLGALGYSPKRVDQAPSQQVNVQITVPGSVVAAARQRMQTIEAQAQPDTKALPDVRPTLPGTVNPLEEAQ